jgi:hypothetical protein
MEGNDLGLLKDYGNYILSGLLIFYGLMSSYLHNEYGTHND